MVAFNFEKQFVPKILAGQKFATIRQNAKCKPGDIMQLYTGMRTKSCELLAEKMCVDVLPIQVFEGGVGIPVDTKDTLKYAYYIGHCPKMLGFDSIDELLGFYKKHYTLPFESYLHVWR